MIPKMPTVAEVGHRAIELSKAGHNAQQMVQLLNAEYKHVPVNKRGQLISKAIIDIMRKAGK